MDDRVHQVRVHMLDLIAARRVALQATALSPGRCLFAEKPRAIGRRFGVYFAAFSAASVILRR